MNKLILLINDCPVAKMLKIRQIFKEIYFDFGVKEIYPNDKAKLVLLKGELKNIQKDDKINMQQIKWFISNLDDILSKFN